MHFFTRNYGMFDVELLYTLTKDLTIYDIKLSDLKHMLDHKMWDGIDESDGNYYIFSSDDLIRGIITNKEHFERIMDANLKYPIILTIPEDIPVHENDEFISYVTRIKGKYDVVDGMHRLSKANIMKLETIKSVIVPWDILKKARIGSVSSYKIYSLTGNITREKSGSYVLKTFL